MVIILTNSDLAKEKRNKLVELLDVTTDFRTYPTNMPSENLYHTIRVGDTEAFLGYLESNGKIFSLNNRNIYKNHMSNENVISTIIRQLSHTQEITISFRKLIRCLSASLTIDELIILAKEIEREAFNRT